MKISISILVFLLVSGIVSAQYDFAAGLRSGGTSGITLKKKYANSAVEGIVGLTKKRYKL